MTDKRIIKPSDFSSDTKKPSDNDAYNDTMLIELYEIVRIGDIDSVIKWSRLFTSDVLYRKYLQNFVFPFHISKCGDTLLHAVCRFGHMDIIKLLIQWSSNDALYEEKDSDYLSILEFLAQKNAKDETAADVAYNTEIIILLEELESRLLYLQSYIKDTQNHSSLVRSILHSDTEKSINLLQKDKSSDIFKIRDPEQGFSICHWICLLNLSTILECCFTLFTEFPLIIKNSVSIRQDYNLLHESIRFSSQKVILYLLAQNMNPHEKNTKGVSPIDLASKRMKKLLKNLDPFVNPSSEKKKREISSKKDSNSSKIDNSVKKKRGRPRSKTDQLVDKLNPLAKEKSTGRRQLHRFAGEGDLDNIKQLVELGAEIDAKDNAGYTALHVAALKGYFDAVKLLLDYGSSSNTCSVDGDTPIHDAITNGHDQIVRLLLENDASDYHNELKPPKLVQKLKLRQDILIS